MPKVESTPGDEDPSMKRRDIRKALDDEVATLIARCEAAQDRSGASSWNVGDSFFPIKHKVPGAQEIAEARLNRFNDIRQVPAPTVNEDPADARVKKIFAYDEPRNTLTFVERKVQTYLRCRKLELEQMKYRTLFASVHSKNSALASSFTSAVDLISDEYRDVLDRSARLGLLPSSHKRELPLYPSRLRSNLDIGDIKVFLKWYLQVDRSSDMMTKFFQRIKAFPFQTFNAIKKQSNKEYLAGCERRMRGSAETPPVLACTAAELRSKVAEAAKLFSLSFEEGGDDHSLSYNVERMFSDTFTSQERCMSFPSLISEGPGGEDDETYLCQSHWIFLVTLRPNLSQVQAEETLRLLEHHKRDGKGTDRILAAEMDFIVEGSLEYVESRIKEMASRRRMIFAASSSSDTQQKQQHQHQRSQAGGDEPEEHMLRCLLRLRLLRARSARRRLLGNLNYFRSIQRRFALDLSGLSYDINPSRIDADKGETSPTPAKGKGTATGGDLSYLKFASASSPANPNPKRVHRVHRQTKVHKRTLALLTGPERRGHFVDDRSSSYGVRVCDGTQTSLMYDATLVDLRSLEDEMLRISSYYVEAFESNTGAASVGAEGDDTSNPSVDRFTVLCDLYESESWYQDAKRKVVEKMVAIYESTFRIHEQKRIAQDITDYMARRPIFDVYKGAKFGSAKYFSEIYASEIVAMDMEAKLLESMMKHQTAIDLEEAPILSACGLHPSLYFLSGLRSMMNMLEQRLEVGNAIRDNASRRILLQELHVQWRLLIHDQKIGTCLNDSKQKSTSLFINSFQVEIAHLLKAAELVTLDKMKERRLEVQAVGEEKASPEDLRKRWSEAQQEENLKQAINAFELVILRSEAKDLLHDCVCLERAFLEQATACHVDVGGDGSTGISPPASERSNADGSVIAIAHIDPEFANYDFDSINGLAKALGSLKLFHLRQLVKFQCLEQHLLLTSLEFNECMLSVHEEFVEEIEFSSKIVDIWRNLAKEKDSTQARLMTENGIEFNDIEIYKRSRLKEARAKIEADATFARKRFLNYKMLQGKMRAQTLSVLSVQTSQIYQAVKSAAASSASLYVQQELQNLKRELLSEYCRNLVRRVESFSLCPALCARAEEIRDFVLRYDLVGDETCSITHRAEVDPFSLDNTAVRFFSHVVSETGWEVPRREHAAHVKESMIARNGSIENVWMIPIRTEVLILCSGTEVDGEEREWRQNEISAMHKCARSMFQTLQPLAALFDLLDIRARCATAPAHNSLSEDANRKTFIAHELMKLESEVESVSRCAQENYGERRGEDGVTLRAEEAKTIDIIKFLAWKRNEWFAHTVAAFQRSCVPILTRAYEVYTREHEKTPSRENTEKSYIDGMESSVFLIRNAIKEASAPSCGILATRLKWHEEDRAILLDGDAVHLDEPAANGDAVDALFESFTSCRQLSFSVYLGPHEDARWLPGTDGLSQNSFTKILRMCIVRMAPHVLQEISACYSRLDLELEGSDANKISDEGGVSSGNVLQPFSTLKDHVQFLLLDLERQALQAFLLEKWGRKFGVETLTAWPENVQEYSSAKHEYDERLGWKFKGSYGQDAERMVESIADALQARMKEQTLLRHEVYTLLQEDDIFSLKALYSSVLDSYSTASRSCNGGSQTTAGEEGGALLDQRAKRLLMVDEFASNVISCSHEYRSVDGHKMELLRKDFARFVSTLKREMIAWSDTVLGSRIQGLLTRNCDLVLRNQKLRATNLALERKLENERLVLNRRISLGVTDGVYQMSHTVDILARRIEKYESEIREQKEVLQKEIHGEYSEKIKSLELDLIRVRAQFGEYKEALQTKMRAEILEVRKEAMLKLVEKGTAPMDAKRALLKVARDGDEQMELLDLNTSLKKTILQLEAVFKSRELESQEQMEMERKRLEKELSKSSEMWERVSAIERKGKAAVEELVITKAQLADVEDELQTMRREYELAVRSKQSLVSWKVAKSREIESLQRALRKYKRWEQVDVEALQQEVESAKEELAKLRNVEDKAERRIKATKDRADKRLEWMRKRLDKETKLKVQAFHLLESSGQGAGHGFNTSVFDADEKTAQTSRPEDHGVISTIWQKHYTSCFEAYNALTRDNEYLRGRFRCMGIEPPSSYTRLGQRIAKSSNSDGVEPVPVHPADLRSIVQKNLNEQRKRQIGQAIAYASTRMPPPSATAKRQRPSSAAPASSRTNVAGQRIERPSTATGSRKKRPVSAKFKKKGSSYKVTVRPISATPATGIKFSTSRKANPRLFL